jgi:hypothetical protein
MEDRALQTVMKNTADTALKELVSVLTNWCQLFPIIPYDVS